MLNNIKDTEVKKCLALKATLTPNRVILLDVMIGNKQTAYSL